MSNTKTNVVKPLTWEQLNALPIANNDMSEAELRKLCLDYMTLMLHFAWTPSHKVDFVNIARNPDKVLRTFEPGKVYGGIPYLTSRMGNLYTAMEYYDEKTGVMDLSGGMDTFERFCNQCSASTFWAWNRVCSSANQSYTGDTTEKNGCLRVGPYEYMEGYIPDNGLGFAKRGCGTDMICTYNGEQTMFESYALVKPADGIVSSSQAHVQMIAAYPQVARREDGTIIGSRSYIYFTDQDGTYHSDLQEDGTHIEYVGGYRTEISFNELLKKHYVPFTFAELNKQKPVDKSVTSMDYSGDTITLEQLSNAKITSNYAVSDITIEVKDEAGQQVYRNLAILYNFHWYGYMKVVDLSKEDINAAVTKGLAEFADGKHTIEISARIGTGEKPLLYSGTLN